MAAFANPQIKAVMALIGEDDAVRLMRQWGSTHNRHQSCDQFSRPNVRI